MQSESSFIRCTIVKLSKCKASICSQARSNKFCQKTKNMVLPLQKFTIKRQRSREVAVKAHECLQKLQGTKGSEVDREGQTRFSGSTSSLTAPVETAETKSAPPKEKDSLPTNQLQVQRNYRRVLKFTSDEDDFLKKGIHRHGFGQWTAILSIVTRGTGYETLQVSSLQVLQFMLKVLRPRTIFCFTFAHYS